ncbi:MAG: amidohydrolase family protein [Desulfobacteraceae bacterium]|nr:amidohydrolase family protein [Desulfobacteraceae bacterium]
MPNIKKILSLSTCWKIPIHIPPSLREARSLAGTKDKNWQARAGWLIDGLGQPALKDVLVVVRNGRLADISAFNASGACKEKILDFRDCTILPALMDAHVHLTLSGTLDAELRKRQFDYDLQSAYGVICAHLEQYWRFGVAAVRDGGDRQGFTHAFKKTELSGSKTPIRIFATDFARHAPGRYGSMLGRAFCETTEKLDSIEKSGQTMDHVKLINSGINSLQEFGKETLPQFSRLFLSKIIQKAHSKKLPVMVHANGEKPVRDALKAGCDSIEHGYFMGPDNLKYMAHHKVAWVPTMIPMAALTDNSALPESEKDVARKNLDHQLDQVAFALKCGVRIALGTDAGSIGVDHGKSVWQEMQLLVTAGLTLEQAISCATANAASVLRAGQTGALKNGWPADLIVVSGDPAAMLEKSIQIKGMHLDGKWRHPDSAAL